MDSVVTEISKLIEKCRYDRTTLLLLVSPTTYKEMQEVMYSIPGSFGAFVSLTINNFLGIRCLVITDLASDYFLVHIIEEMKSETDFPKPPKIKDNKSPGRQILW